MLTHRTLRRIILILIIILTLLIVFSKFNKVKAATITKDLSAPLVTNYSNSVVLGLPKTIITPNTKKFPALPGQKYPSQSAARKLLDSTLSPPLAYLKTITLAPKNNLFKAKIDKKTVSLVHNKKISVTIHKQPTTLLTQQLARYTLAPVLYSSAPTNTQKQLTNPTANKPIAQLVSPIITSQLALQEDNKKPNQSTTQEAIKATSNPISVTTQTNKKAGSVAPLATNQEASPIANPAVLGNASTSINTLTAKQNEELKNLDELYRKYKVIKAKFLQTDSLGNRVQGWFVIQKPGKARIEYENLPLRIIASGKSLMLQDLKLKQKSFLPITASPFSYLLDENASLINENILIKDFKTYDEYHEITLVNKETPGLGYLVLYLTLDRAEIIKWSVYDAKGTVTDVYLLDAQFLQDNVANQNIFNVQNVKNIAYDDIK